MEACIKFQLLRNKIFNAFFMAEPIYDERKRLYDMHILDVNTEFEKWSNVDKINIIGKTRDELPMIFNSRETNLEYYRSVLTGDVPISFEWKRTEDICFVVTIFKMKKNVVGVMINDVSEQKKQEKSIRKILENFEAIIESTEDPIWSVDKKYRIVYMNSALRNLFKEYYNLDILQGMETRNIENCECIKVWIDYYDRVLKSGQLLVDNVEIKGNKQFQVTLNPICRDGEVVGIACFGRDITAQMKAENEIKMLNTELEQKVEQRTIDLQLSINDLEAFTNIVSHDLKAPLRSIETYCRFIIEDHFNTLGPEVKALVNKIHSDSIDTIHLVEKLLSYSKTAKTNVCPERIDLKLLVKSVFDDVLKFNNPRKVELKMQENLPCVFGDRLLMRQVIKNIISNAVKFTKYKPIGIITVGYSIGENADTFYFKDNGVGFDMEFSGKLFGMFERLHSAKEFEGNGIGLATISKIINKHGGKTWIEGKVNEGATIYFTLPK